MQWIDDALIYAHLGSAMAALMHYCCRREYHVARVGEAEAMVVWRVCCSCGWQGPAALNEYYLTDEDARSAEREHESQTKARMA